MSKEKVKHEDGFDHLEGALTSSEQFIEKNQKMLINIVLVLVIIIGGYFGYKHLVSEPKAKEASSQIFGAQNYFEKDSFNLALNGDGNILGFVEIADKYSSTPAGKFLRRPVLSLFRRIRKCHYLIEKILIRRFINEQHGYR